MTFRFVPAIRERVSLIIAIAGASGGGKTLSALKIARGLAGGDDSKIAVIDTEAGRAKHYAVAPGEKISADRFAFHHGDLQAPFEPEAYAAAIKSADEAGRFDVIMVDSCSHEYEGEGGLHDIHNAEVAIAVEKSRAAHNQSWGAFDPARASERASVGAWREPKSRHKRFVSRLLQCRSHLILCLRADEKIRIEKVKDERGRERTVIVQPKDMPPGERWVPICEKRFMYEMTLSLIVAPQNPGIPIPIKLQQQHRAAVPIDQHLSEQTGRALAAWARGDQPTAQTGTAPQPPASSGQQPPAVAPDEAESASITDLHDELTKAAELGSDALKEAWEKIRPADQKLLKSTLEIRHKKRAAEVDAGKAAV